MSRRPPSLELRIVTSRGGRERSVRLARGARVALAVGVLALFGGLLALVAAAPSALASLRARRQYEVDLARREQIGERLRALVDRLAELDEQARALAQRVDRYEAVYGLPPTPDWEPNVHRAAPRAARAAPETIFAGTIVLGRKLAAQLAARLDRLDRQLIALIAWEQAHPEEPGTLPLSAPLAADAVAVPASGFGVRRSAPGQALEFHSGLDFAAPAGTPVLATADGLVTWSGEAPADAGAEWWRLGSVVVVRHGDRFLTVYGHCDRLLVPRGRRVRTGEPIASVGAAGWVVSPRLHYEIRRLDADGVWRALDPRLILLAGEAPAGAVGATGASSRPVPAPVPQRFLR